MSGTARPSDDQEARIQASIQSAIAKASWRILPLIGLGYLFSFMDRVNIGFAALEMNSDLGFSATVFGFGAGIFFLSFALFEIPSCMLMSRFGARRWLARIMITWGFCATATMFVQTPWQFYTVRFLLGVAEAGYFPVIIYYLAFWFPKSARGRTISYFYLFGPLASVVLGSVSGAMLSMDGIHGLHGWQWLLMLQGLPAVFIGLFIWRFLPDEPAKAEWLAAEERAGLQSILERESAAIGLPVREGIIATMRDPVVIQLALIGALLVGTGITLSINLPLVLQATTKLNAYQIGFVVSASGLMAICAMVVAGRISDRRGSRFAPAIACALGSSAGIALVALHPSTNLTIGAWLLLSCGGWSQALLFAAMWPDLLHPGRLALGGATIDMVSQIGAFAGPYAWGIAKDATGTFTLALWGLALTTLFTASFFALLMYNTKAYRHTRALQIDRVNTSQSSASHEWGPT